MGGSCPYRAQSWRRMSRDPGRCIYDAKTGYTRHSPSELGSALVCTVSVPGLCAWHSICAFSAPSLRLRLFCFHISIFQFFNFVGLFMRKSPTMSLSKQGTQVTNSYFALKYAKNDTLAQSFEFQENIVFAGRKDNSCVAKAPFLHPESSAFGIPYTMF